MSSLAAIIAATLSLTAPTNYVWTTPPASNYIQGVGIGTKGAYVVPRLEDVAFLDEAYAERDRARGNISADIYAEYLPPTVTPVGEGVFDWEDLYHYSTNSEYVAYFSLFPLTFGGWGMACDGVYSLYHPGAFVSPNFSLDSQAGMAVADTNWCVNGVSTMPTNGLAFLTRNTFQSCILPARTNTSFMGAMALGHVTNAYYNAGLCGPVLGVGQDYYGGPDPILMRQISYGGGSEARSEADYTYETYTYPNYQTGGTGTGRRLSGVTPRQPVEDQIASEDEYVELWDRWTIGRTATKTKRHEYGSEILYIAADGSAVTTNRYVGQPWISYSSANYWQNRPTTSPTNRLEMSHLCLSTNAVKDASLIDGVDFMIVAQMTATLTDSLISGSADDYTTNRASVRVVGWLRDDGATRLSASADEAWPVYGGAANTGTLLRLWFTQAAALLPTSSISDSEVPDPATLGPYGSALLRQASLYRRVSLTIERVWRYPLIHRRYNAYFTED